MYPSCNENMANDNNGQYYSEQCSNGQLHNDQWYHGTTMKNSNFTNIFCEYNEMHQGQVLTSNLNESSTINYENLEEMNTADSTKISSLPELDSILSSSINLLTPTWLLPSSTSVSPLSNSLTCPSPENEPSSLNNYEENSYCETQVPSINIMPNGYSNSEVHSEVIYPQYGHEPHTIEEYNSNQIGTGATPSTEWSYNHGPEYLQDVTCENQNYYSYDKSICSQNRKISSDNNSLISKAGMDNGNTGAKRSRQVYNKIQIKILEDEYKKNKFIKKARKAELAKMLSLSEKSIQIWFQNRRAKAKK